MSKSPFLESIRRDLRLRGYSIRTEKTYLHWIKRFILFHQRRHPAEMGAPEVRVFLTSLANDNGVSVNTQKIALNALAFLYHKFLGVELGPLDFKHARQHRRLPTVLTRSEVAAILSCMSGRNWLIFSLLWQWGTYRGMSATSCQRRRFRYRGLDCRQRQGRQGSQDIAEYNPDV
ncbi:phage integrase N-terminal SAM-like domain-containing protein [Halomonas sp.]|uniref:phage integrase N-terminal SAM-like domain-containing protein n=1 Tax=Halomonas sp. TaxID=1486246 RepID=UPI00257F79A5|nr:phage integrase N-terminal SAM-like domain-containing protein [Halomonas sp.]MCJ8287631.1 site-specific integrase [Halomonas sp.]